MGPHGDCGIEVSPVPHTALGQATSPPSPSTVRVGLPGSLSLFSVLCSSESSPLAASALYPSSSQTLEATGKDGIFQTSLCT
jgi:hypothetical protein